MSSNFGEVSPNTPRAEKRSGLRKCGKSWDSRGLRQWRRGQRANQEGAFPG